MAAQQQQDGGIGSMARSELLQLVVQGCAEANAPLRLQLENVTGVLQQHTVQIQQQGQQIQQQGEQLQQQGTKQDDLLQRLDTMHQKMQHMEEAAKQTSRKLHQNQWDNDTLADQQHEVAKIKRQRLVRVPNQLLPQAVTVAGVQAALGAAVENVSLDSWEQRGQQCSGLTVSLTGDIKTADALLRQHAQSLQVPGLVVWYGRTQLERRRHQLSAHFISKLPASITAQATFRINKGSVQVHRGKVSPALMGGWLPYPLYMHAARSLRTQRDETWRFSPEAVLINMDTDFISEQLVQALDNRAAAGGAAADNSAAAAYANNKRPEPPPHDTPSAVQRYGESQRPRAGEGSPPRGGGGVMAAIAAAGGGASGSGSGGDQQQQHEQQQLPGGGGGGGGGGRGGRGRGRGRPGA
jgi:hypothetical protein